MALAISGIVDYMSGVPRSVLLLIVLGLVFDFLNGLHDSSSIVATMVASRAVTARQALAITAVAEFVGPFLFGMAVATTMGDELVAASAVRLEVMLAAVIAAIIWSIITWRSGIPSSSSHALVGGLIGAAMADSGPGVIRLAGLGKVVLALAISPLLGLAAGYLIMKLVLFLARNSSPKINGFFKRGQIVTALVLALAHGTNDAQKTMGIIALGLVAGGVEPTFRVPLWVVALCAGVIALGTAMGSRRLIRTLGSKFFRVRPLHGFTTQVASAAVILTAAILGGPVSTTQVVSSAIMGVGSAERLSQVRWGMGRQIALVWLTTIPFAAILAAILAVLLRRWL
jgi:PiT family inorganic phosphate transporter